MGQVFEEIVSEVEVRGSILGLIKSETSTCYYFHFSSQEVKLEICFSLACSTLFQQNIRTAMSYFSSFDRS